MGKVVNEENVGLWNGISESYHDSRPVPPSIVKKIILSWLKKEPETIVDIGCGTGLSTIIWRDMAKNIIGIEPNDDMRATAEKNAASDGIVFKKGFSNETNLPSGYADIITVSQAFHWMDIDSTLIEFYRVLKPGGVLAVYDFALPPIMDWEIEKAFLKLRTKCGEIVYSQEAPPVHNDKNMYNDRIKAFGKFRHSREAAFYGVEKSNLQRLIQLFANISNASFAMKIDPTIKKDIDEFEDLVKKSFNGEIELIFPYKMVIAVK